MPPDPRADALRRGTARRLARNVVAMSEASDAEFGQGEAFVAGALRKLAAAVVLLGLGAILASGWPVWGQLLAIVAFAAAFAAVRIVWMSHAPPPAPEPDPAPPFARLTPRRRHGGLSAARSGAASPPTRQASGRPAGEERAGLLGR